MSWTLGFLGSSAGKESACNAGNLGSILGLGRCPGEGNGNPLQYSCLENPMAREAWRATVHGVARVRHNWGTNTLTWTSSISWLFKASGKRLYMWLYTYLSTLLKIPLIFDGSTKASDSPSLSKAGQVCSAPGLSQGVEIKAMEVL